MYIAFYALAKLLKWAHANAEKLNENLIKPLYLLS